MRCLGLEKQIANLTTKIEMEMEARGVAEQEKRDAEAQANLLKKQNKVRQCKSSTRLVRMSEHREKGRSCQGIQ